jgi:small-conductance mechanosensitive channel
MNLTDIPSSIYQIFQYKLFEINRTPVTPSSVIMFVIVIIVFFLLSRLLQKVLKNQFLTRFRIDPGTQYTLSRISHYIIMIIGCLFAFQLLELI